eukprot:1072697-Prorocentrum_minimum.AAC.2
MVIVHTGLHAKRPFFLIVGNHVRCAHTQADGEGMQWDAVAALTFVWAAVYASVFQGAGWTSKFINHDTNRMGGSLIHTDVCELESLGHTQRIRCASRAYSSLSLHLFVTSR